MKPTDSPLYLQHRGCEKETKYTLNTGTVGSEKLIIEHLRRMIEAIETEEIWINYVVMREGPQPIDDHPLTQNYWRHGATQYQIKINYYIPREVEEQRQAFEKTASTPAPMARKRQRARGAPS